MKKGFKLVACFYGLLSTGAYANWYADLNLGANLINTSKQLSYPLEEPNITQAQLTSANNDFHAQLALGRAVWSNESWHIALEGDLDFFTGYSNYSVVNWFLGVPAVAREQLDYSFGILILPTYQLNEQVQLFFGPELSSSHFKINTAFAPTAGNFGVSRETGSWLSGWGFKTGTSITISRNLDLLLTYQYTAYNSLTSTAIEPLSGSILAARYQPNVNLVMVGLKYLFGREIASSLKMK